MELEERKSLYRKLAKIHDFPLQLQPWWLDIVCQPDWDVALSIDNAGNLKGALPIFQVKKWGLRITKMPPLTDYLGPFITEPAKGTKLHTSYTREKSILEELIQQLPPSHLFFQQYYPDFENLLPFHWAGFRQNVRYTYRFDSDSDINDIYQNLKGSIRTNLKKSEKYISLNQVDDIEPFINLNQETYAQKGIIPNYQAAMLRQLDIELKNRDQRTLLLAVNKINERVEAGLYLVHDNRSTYALLSGVKRGGESHAAMQALYWHAIKRSLDKGLGFDFCGSMDKGIEHLFRSFGAQRVPYFMVYKSSNRLLEVLALLSRTVYGGQVSG
ncbi:MAG: GNAT family N-acetyltransferase [Flavobacteriales bacterium]|nr:GNAT family N-acetyltransferase [Flavobacteriales bacterium]